MDCSDHRYPWRVVLIEACRQLRHPMVVLEAVVLCSTSVATAMHPEGGTGLFIAIRIGHYAAIIGIGAVAVADLHAKDPSVVEMIMERGACRPAGVALAVGSSLMWTMVCLPSLVASVLVFPHTWSDVLLQTATIGAASAMVAAGAQMLCFFSVARGWHEFGGWLVPVAIIVSYALYLTLGVFLISPWDSLLSREIVALVFTSVCGILAFVAMVHYAGGLPRRQCYGRVLTKDVAAF